MGAGFFPVDDAFDGVVRDEIGVLDGVGLDVVFDLSATSLEEVFEAGVVEDEPGDGRDRGVLLRGVLLPPRGCLSFSVFAGVVLDFKGVVVLEDVVLGLDVDGVFGVVVVGLADEGLGFWADASFVDGVLLGVVGFEAVVDFDVALSRLLVAGLAEVVVFVSGVDLLDGDGLEADVFTGALSVAAGLGLDADNGVLEEEVEDPAGFEGVGFFSVVFVLSVAVGF